MKRHTRWLTAAIALAVIGTGCASRKYVRQEGEALEGRVGERVSGVEGQVEDAQARLDDHEVRIDELSDTTREALERALEAGQLAEGKFLYETVLSDDNVKFGFDQADLSDEAKAALDAFATEIKERNENVFIEIQGHTDNVGGEDYNLTLGEDRAESVRRYLSRTHGIALHRMGVISYGKAAPVADNSSREGRAKNRRVSLVVLQ